MVSRGFGTSWYFADFKESDNSSGKSRHRARTLISFAFSLLYSKFCDIIWDVKYSRINILYPAVLFLGSYTTILGARPGS